ncbi:MAG: ATP-binding cassette domain-containing protein [Betaproteobacteria bacterium]|nr:ATP-binding cassette domain-containing protein [Betaproteobacteria bacterium]MDE2360275.1 ATP-binding cassette domain-containing protein [Betaproteobacteria bacterium]
MIRISNLTLARGHKRLLEAANLTVHVGHKVGIVGANGCGKSSLFAAIRGELLPDAGAIELPPRWTLAHVAQETRAVAIPVIEYVQDGDRELRDIEQALAAAGAAHGHLGGRGPGLAGEVGGVGVDGARLAELHHRFEAIGGYSARARAATLLAGLGFDAPGQGRSVESFSGGWRMRLNLAQALMCRSDLLLLDEPTNHLDLDAVLWLEDWLRRYPGTLLLVTHDRDFLDAVADTIVHLDGGKLIAYTGNYAQFERERAQQLAQQQAAHAKQQRQVAHLKAYIDRFRAKATKARQAQSRIKALERMELIAAAHVDSPFSFSFPAVDASARQLVRLEHASLGYAGVAPVLDGVEWAVLAGSRIGLLGANGAGKSTLLKSLAGTLPLVSGVRHAAQNLRLGYFAQHQVEQLRGDQTPLWHLRRLEPDTREQELRDYLGGFDFRGDMATAGVGRFSGGEKARLALALIVRQRPDLLLLDEPTNHLDIEMREALTEALQDYGGALILVAHDRYLLRATADELWLLADGRLAPFDGDLDDYKAWVLGRERRAGRRADDAVEPAKAPTDRRSRKREEALARQQRSDQRKPLIARQAVLERDMESMGAEKKLLDAWLASPDAYTDGAKPQLVAALARQGELTFNLARLESEWLAIAEALEGRP